MNADGARPIPTIARSSLPAVGPWFPPLIDEQLYREGDRGGMRAGLFRVWASERSAFCRSASKIRRLLRLMIHEEDESAQILISISGGR